MAGRSDNAFEVLSREEAAPEGQLVKEVGVEKKGPQKGGGDGGAPGQAAAPSTPSREAPQPKAQPAVNPDISKAPGGMSYAEAAQKHGETAKDKAGESAQAGKEAVSEAAQAVSDKGADVGKKAGDKARAARESAQQAAGEVQDRAAETGEQAKQKAGEAAESAKHTATDVRHKAEELAEATKERAAQAGHAAREYTDAAKEKASDVAHTVTDTVSQAVGYIKEHLPEVHLPEVHVEHEEPAPEDRESQALLDEAMALAGGAPVPIHTSMTEAPAAAPSRPAGESTGGAASTPPAVNPASEVGGEPYRAYEPRTATDVANRTSEKVAEATEAAREKASQLVHDAPGFGAAREEDTGSRAREAAKAVAPDEMAARMEREDRSAKRPLEALADAVKGAAEYVKEKVMHVPAATNATAAEVRDTTVGSMRSAGQEIEDTARAAADKAEATLEQARETVGSIADTASAKVDQAKEAAGSAADSAKETASSAADTVSAKVEQGKEAASDTVSRVADNARSAVERADEKARAVPGTAEEQYEQTKAMAENKAEAARDRSAGLLESARDTVSGAVQAVEDKAKWAYEHTKEELKQGAEHWNEPPKTPEEAARAAGIIPSDTQTLLKQRGTAAYEEHEPREIEERNKLRTEELLEEAALAYGEENLAPSDIADVPAEAEGGGLLAGPPRNEGEGAGGGGEALKSALDRVSAGTKAAAEELKHELKEAVEDMDHDRPGDEGEIPS